MGGPPGRGGGHTHLAHGNICGSLTGTLPSSGGPPCICVPCSGRHQHPKGPALYLQEGFLLLQMLADHWGDVVRLRVGAQLVGSSAPVLFSLVLLLQALKDTADL